MARILNICLAVFVAGAAVYLVAEEVRRDDERGTVVVSFMSTGSREQKESYQRVIREFEKENPGIRIRLQWGTTGRFFGVVLTRMAGGVAPDVVFMYESMMPHFADKNTLEDLTPYIERDLPDYRADFHPLARRIFAYHGRTYAMPVTLAPLLVVYNKNLFDEAGVPYPRDNWTWDEFLETASKLTKRDEHGRIVQYGFSHALSYRLIEKMTPQRGLVAGPPVRANYAHPEIVAAVRFATELLTKHRVAPNTAVREATTGPLFNSGKGAMTITGRWMCPTYNKIEGLRYDVAPMPRWRDGKRRTYTHAVGYAMSRECRDKEAAWKFVKYLGSRKSQRILTELGDTVPTRRSILFSDACLPPDVPPANDRAYIDSLDYSRFSIVTDPAVPNYFQQAVEALNLGDGDIEAKLKEAEELTNRFIQNRNVRVRE